MTASTVAALAARITDARLERALTVRGLIWVRPKDGAARFVMAPSQSQPGLLYRVDGRGCSCPGYQNHGHCRHFACVMLRLAERLTTTEERAAA